MSAESLRRKGGSRMSGILVRPQNVSEKTLMESVAGLINEVGLVAQPYSTSEDKQNSIAWTKFEMIKDHVLKLGVDSSLSGETNQHPQSMLLTLGYHSGVQMWNIPMNGEAQEVLSWRRPSIRLLQLLPSPVSNQDDSSNDKFKAARPIVATVDGSNSPTCPNHLMFTSLRSGEVLKSTKFVHPVCDLLVNSMAVIVSFLDKIIVLDPYKLELRTTISSHGLNNQTPGVNPIALGSSWLATTDRKLQPAFQSAGGVETAGPPSYTATVIYAAKSLTKGLKGLGETVANSITGHRVPMNSDHSNNAVSDPGIVTILNLAELKSGEFSMNELSCSASNSITYASVIAHFVAHQDHSVQALSFDHSGLLLVTADKGGHDFHVFRIHPHPLGSTMAAVHHLYVLHRGDTVAKVQDISFSSDSRWVAVSTLRGTTHIFPITPYGGAISVRTHASHRVVNRLSRFHRTAGLDDAPTSGRSSPVLTFNPGSSVNNPMSSGKSYDLLHLGAPYPNPRLPPFPHPVVVLPLAQLRHSFNTNSSPKSSPPISKSKGIFTNEERNHVVASFQPPRGWMANSPLIVPHCDKRKKSSIDAVFIMTCHGNLIEYCLEPKPSSVIAKDKIPDDAPIELSVHARAQWNFTKPSFRKDLQPPLGEGSMMVQSDIPLPSSMNNCKSSTGDSHKNSTDSHGSNNDNDESPDERWLSQVEITTHSGPHRRLWMGPQFTFKVFNSSTTSPGNQGGVVDVETVEVNVTNRPAKSNPVNMPVSSSLLPVVIEGSSGSSLEQSPRLDPYCDDETSFVANESQIKENLADAMMENCTMSSRNTGGCQSLGSFDDLSSSSFDSTSQHSSDTPNHGNSFFIEANLPFPD